MRRLLSTMGRAATLGAFLASIVPLLPATAVAFADERSWTGEIPGVGPDYAVVVHLSQPGSERELLTVNATNTGTVPWGDCHFGIFDPIGGQNIAGVAFLDASMGGEDPLSSQAGLRWVINNDLVGATIDLTYCSDPVAPGETASFTVYLVNPDQIFYGVMFYPTPVPPDGACCNPNGDCTLACSYDCLPPSIWHGEWTTCSPNPCPQPPPVGACCDPVGGCTVTIQAECLSPGIWHPEWLSCEPNFCPPPIRAHSTTWGEIKSTYR